jgi:hypothetical protein
LETISIKDLIPKFRFTILRSLASFPFQKREW